MVRWFTDLAAAAHRADFWARACFVGLSCTIASASFYSFLAASGVLTDGLSTATMGGPLMGAFCAFSQFCALNLSYMARRRDGHDRAVCVVLMLAFGLASAFGLEHFWEVWLTAAAERSGTIFEPIRTLEDIGPDDVPRLVISVGIALAEPVVYWVFGNETRAPGRQAPNNIETLDPSRRRAGRRAATAVMAAALAVGTMPMAVSADARTAPTEPSQGASRAARDNARDIGFADVERVSDRLHRDGERVSLRRVAAELGTSKSKIERVLNAAGVSIAERWPPSRPLMAA